MLVNAGRGPNFLEPSAGIERRRYKSYSEDEHRKLQAARFAELRRRRTKDGHQQPEPDSQQREAAAVLRERFEILAPVCQLQEGRFLHHAAKEKRA